ncbi:thermonuclease family protein [Robiginitomaculum antarcticum]|uniref:thermonuclease family protein n=1 Tax=Robiginitomaculum antarcticum TaxID=437507 RepID=UPI00037C797A|nr:thermonuclease family protein [Robiginitomaculum antarcticum]
MRFRSALKRLSLVTIATAASLSTTGLAAPDLTEGERGKVSRISDGDTLYLDSGLKVRLAGIQAPKLSLGREDFTDWPLGQESKAALARLTLGRDVQLRYGGTQRDRYDRALAQVFVGSPDASGAIWVQEDMVRSGMARVYSWPDTQQDTARLYAAEREARAAKRGMWALDYYAVRKPDPDPLAQDVDSFQIIEGVITSTANVRGQIYLNFGSDYRTDFTVSLTKDGKKRFKKAGIDPVALEGARVRVRGWIELYNGPAIYLSDPDRLEVLD